MNKDNSSDDEYDEPINSSEMNKESKKILAPIASFLKSFSIVIIFFLIMSYVSNKYIPGLFMNYIPMFFPVGKLFCRNLKFVSLFHSPLEKYEDKTSNKFFEKEKIVVNDCNDTEATYYKLLSFGSSLLNILKGGFINLELSPEIYKDIPECKVYLLEDNKLYWYQKIIVSIFGAIQLFIGPFLSLFCAFAYLFSGKAGYFLNAIKMRQKNKNEKGEELFINLENQIKKENPYELLFKSSSSTFNTFFNYLNFLTVDKLSYGASYFLQKNPTPCKAKYFFLILFIIILYATFKNSDNWIASIVTSIIILIVMFFIYGKYSLEPFADFKAFENIKIEGEESPINLNTYAEKRDELKKDVLDKMSQYIKNVNQKKEEYLKQN
jgi:hypothetical protein